MPIGNLKDMVSSADLDAARARRNPSEYEEGFGDDMNDDNFTFEDDDDGFDSLDGFGDSGDEFGSGGFDSFDSFGDSSSSGFDSLDSFGGSSGFGNTGTGLSTNTPAKPDAMDIAMETGGKALSATWRVTLELIKSVKSRNADDWGKLSTNYIKIGAVLMLSSIALGIFGGVSGLKAFKFGRIPIHLLMGGGLVLSTGLIGIGSSALKIIKDGGGREADEGEYFEEEVEPIEENDMDDLFGSSDSSEEDDEFDSLMDDLFGDDDGDDVDMQSTYVDDEPEEEKEPEQLGADKVFEQAPSNLGVLNRGMLYEVFKSMFPTNTPGFSDTSELDPSSDEFLALEDLALSALAQAENRPVEELTSRLESVTDAFFCYRLRMSRGNIKSKVEKITEEMEAFFRSNAEDTSVVVTVDIEGKMFRITVTKGKTAIITFGDCFKLTEVEDFYRNPKNIFPIIAGIDTLGKPILTDAKDYSTMLIAGKPRSGKSWYVDSILISMMAFNLPEDVQFLIIDPKESNLFKTIACMPHVCGLHNSKNILQILKDLIDKEGERRNNLLKANHVDDIWALREKGVKLPVLYIVIDEYMTLVGELGKQITELTTLMNTIISQFPSKGIRLIFVPHRAQGVVDKTTRTLIDYVAAVRADNDTVLETLGLKKFKYTLVNRGDTALKLADVRDAMFVKGAAITTSDNNNTEVISYMASTFYKMGVEIPDMSTIGCGYNRDEAEIMDELKGMRESKKVQYDLDDVSDIDLSAISENDMDV